MKLAVCVCAIAGIAASALARPVYSGNGNSGFGGPIGLGSLTITDDGTTVSGTVNKGPNGFNDVLVLYVDSGAGGFADTSGFSDSNDGLRRAISGFDGGSNRSLLTFAGGFQPDYAIALGPSSDSFGGVFQLVNGGGGSLNYSGSANLSPTGTNSSPTYTFSFTHAQIGLALNAPFSMFGTYTSNSGYRSDEALPGNAVGSQGWNPFLQTGFVTVPTPGALALLGLGGMAAARRRRA